MEHKYNFGIDIDGTITSPSTFIPFINKSFNVDLSIEDIKEFNLATALQISDEEFMQWLWDNELEIYKNPPIVAGAIETLSNWQQHQLIYISARHSRYKQITNEWFQVNQIPHNQIICTGNHNKVAPILERQIDIFFEDNYMNACQIAEHCHIPVVLFDTPYNKGTLPSNVLRVSGWYEAQDVVNQWITSKVPQLIK